MNRPFWPFLIIALIAFLFLVRHRGGDSSDTIEYRGEQFKMSKAYTSYEDYKDDQDNLDTNELERIEKVMVEASLPSSYTTTEEFVHTLLRLKFPGYGLGGIEHEQDTNDTSTIEAWSVEIPQRDKERYFVLRGNSGHFIVVDDFVSSTATNAIREFKLLNGKLVYYDQQKRIVRKKALSAK